MRRVLISTKPFIFVLFPVCVTVRSAESLSSAIPLGTSNERANSKRANHGQSRLFQDAILSVSFWLRSFSVCGWRTRSLSSVSGPPTRWSCVRGWLMRLLWAYEHDFAAISPFLYERIGISLARAEDRRLTLWEIWGLLWLTTTPCPGAFLPGGAWGADEFVDGPFHGQKPLVRLLRPHYPRWRSGQGVRGHSPGGESAATWRNRPNLPSKACKLTAALAAKAYSAAGQAASALHAMAILQVHQAKALKQVHEGSTDPGLMQELRTATDFALRATKVMARSLGKAMSTMVVQERHLWLNLAEMKDVDKACFLDAPISQGGLFGDTVEGFALQFSAVQQQTEAIQHILPRRDAPSTAAPGARPQSAHRRGRPPASSRAAPPQAESTHRPVRRASRRRAAPPASQPGPKSSRKSTKGFTALTSLYPRKVVAFGQSWICESWTRLCTSSRSRCWRTGAWSNAFSPRIGLQRSTWRTLTFTFSILPLHRPFLRFAFEGRAWQYRVLPFGLSLSPRVFTKVVEGALTPLREVGVRILNYLDDWLILAQSREQLGDHRDLVIRHLSQLGLRVNWEKSKLSPVQRISFLGVELDSVSMTARLTEERAQAVLNCLSSFRGRNVVPLKQFQRLLGHMASAAAVTPLGLLHMRPLQHWLHSQVPRWAWRRGTLREGISQQCRCSLSPWTDLAFLRAGVPLEQVSRHTVVTTDASSTGWGATCNGQAASGLWTGPRLLWHINCLELWAVHLALRQFQPLLLGKHVLVRMDNTAAVSYIIRLRGIRSQRMSQLARHLLLWSHTQLKSLRVVHIPGQLNRAADALSRQLTFPGEWRLHPEMIRLIWSRFGEAQVDLFASPESSHCQLYFSHAFPPVSLLAQTLCKLREDKEQVLLVAPHWPTRTWFPKLISLATAPPWRIPLRKDLLSQGLGTIWHPRPDLWNLHVWLLDGTRQTWVVYHRRW